MFIGHSFPHPPQFLPSVLVFTSHPFAAFPSQSAVPAMHIRAPLHTLFVQVMPLQSVPCWHIRPSSQALHVPPPQSTSVSAPSCLPFSQGDAAHVPLVHVMLAQSLPALHFFPT